MNLISNPDNRNSVGSQDPTQPQRGSGLGNSSPVPPPVPRGRETEESGSFGGLRVSLMPTGQEGEAGGVRRWLIILLVALLIETVAIGAGYLFLMNREGVMKDKRATMERNIDDIAAKISEVENDAKEAALLGTRARTASEILDNHLYWTKVFLHLASQTKPGVTYLNFAGDAKTRIITMDALGTNYREVAEQIVALREDPAVESVVAASASSMTNVRGEITGISFSLLITLKPEMWLTQAQADQEIE